MTMALTALAGSVMGALGQQSRSAQATQRYQDQSTLAIATARDAKTAKAASENARQERLMAILMDPQIMGLLTVFGGIYAANVIPWHEDPVASARISGVAAASAVLMGLGRAGVGDLTTLGVAAAAGMASAGPGAVGDISQELVPGSGVPWYLTGSPVGAALAVKHRLFG